MPMANAPNTLRLPNGVVARQDVTRLAAWLRDAARAGDPVLTPPVRARLATIGLRIEGDSGKDGDNAALRAINHGPHLIWLQAVRKLSKPPATADVARALGRALAWTTPAYRLPASGSRPGEIFAVRPDVVLLQAPPGGEATADALAKRLGLRRSLDKCRFPGAWRYLQVPPKGTRSAFDLIAELRRQRGPTVEFEYLPHASPFLHTPDDEFFGEQWYLTRIGAPAAWDITRGAAGVRVAVIDSGCDLVHPDLASRFDGPGRNAADPTADGSPVVSAPSGRLQWHGTAVAGVIAASIDNGLGMSGIAGASRLVAIALPTGTTVEFADAITYAVDSGAHVVCLSLAIGEVWFSMARPAIDDAVAHGVVFCASAGNRDMPHLVFPAHDPAVMACGGSDRTDVRWRVPSLGFGSHYGDELYDHVPTGVSVVAPAEDIASTDIAGPDGFTPADSPGGDYLQSVPGIPSAFYATSAAAPQVAGAAALVKSAYPALDGRAIRRIIERTADKVGGYAYVDVPGYPNGTRHPEMGYGRLNIHQALDLGDVMIADWSGDTGLEPSSPPGGRFYAHSDITIGPAGDTDFLPDSDEASRLVAGSAHTIAVRVRSIGPATARAVTLDVRATPFVGLEFLYPDDWTHEDALHVRPSVIEPVPATLAAGTSAIARFGLTAAQSSDLAGWTPMGWHPCLLAVVSAENDYAFANTPGGRDIVARRNNIAQRNLTVTMTAERASLPFPFVVGHPSNKEARLELVIEIGHLARDGEVLLNFADASRAFPAARRAQAFGKGTVKVGKLQGARVVKQDGGPAVRIESPQAIVEIIRPEPARYALRLDIRLPKRGGEKRYPVYLSQRVAARGTVGGASLVVVRK
jgi:subtilisin family serine protease